MEWIELGELADIETGKLNANAASDDGKYPFFTCADEILKIDEYAYDKECILVAGNGNLNVKYYSGKFNAYQRTYIIESKDKKRLNSKYLYYFMNIYMDKLRKMSIGGVIKYIKLGHLQTAKIPVPSLAIQEQIVEVLDRAQELIDKRRAQIQAMDSLIESIFYTMFGDPVRNEKGWEVKELGDVTEIITGNTPPRKEVENYGNYIEWIKSDNINTPHTYLTEAKEYLSKKGKEKGRVAPSGSILMTCIAGSLSCIGNVAISDREVAFNQQINAIIPQKYNLYFLYILFKLTKLYVQNNSTSSMKGMISKGTLSELEYILPPLDLQNEFAQKVELIEREKEVLEESLELMEENYRSIMDRAFKGELFN